MSRAVTGGACSRSETQEAMVAPMWTAGPSRPVEPPVESVISAASAEATPTLRSTRPLPTAAASITASTARGVAPGASRETISPTARPPMIGTVSTTYQGRSAATEWISLSEAP